MPRETSHFAVLDGEDDFFRELPIFLPHAPESVVAWRAALDALAKRPEIDGKRLGAFGVSRGGLWVMRLAAHDARVKALIS